MFSLFLNGYRLLKIICTGLKKDEEFRFLFVFIILLLIGANIFYVKVEHWSVIDALYFSVMTMATVGYGDLTPVSDISKLFTTVYAFLSIGSFVSFTAKTVQLILEKHNKDKEKLKRKLNKQ